MTEEARIKMGDSMRGKHHTEETKKKIRKTKLGKLHPHKGHPFSEKARQRANEVNKERIGDKNPNWIGGSLAYFRNLVLIRDDYICQVCGFREPGIMEVDHILPRKKYPDLVKSLDNMITLCPNCHRRKTNRDKKIK